MALRRGDGAPFLALTAWAAIVIYFHGQRALFRYVADKTVR